MDGAPAVGPAHIAAGATPNQAVRPPCRDHASLLLCASTVKGSQSTSCVSPVRPHLSRGAVGHASLAPQLSRSFPEILGGSSVWRSFVEIFHRNFACVKLRGSRRMAHDFAAAPRASSAMARRRRMIGYENNAHSKSEQFTTAHNRESKNAVNAGPFHRAIQGPPST